MTFWKAVLGSLVLTGFTTAALPVFPHGPQRHLVHLVGYTYDPGDLVVQRGDTIRFVQETALPHNVEFTASPAGAALGDAQSGPYLIKEGDTYDLVINERFPRGEYAFHCTPHQTLGMKGTLVVR